MGFVNNHCNSIIKFALLCIHGKINVEAFGILQGIASVCSGTIVVLMLSILVNLYT